MTRDGSQLISASRDKLVIVWNTSDGSRLHILEGHDSVVRGLCLTIDESFLFSASWDSSIMIWNLENGQSVGKMKGHPKDINSCVLTSSNSKLFSASDDKTIKMWGNRTLFENNFALFFRFKVENEAS